MKKQQQQKNVNEINYLTTYYKNTSCGKIMGILIFSRSFINKCLQPITGCIHKHTIIYLEQISQTYYPFVFVTLREKLLHTYRTTPNTCIKPTTHLSSTWQVSD